MSLLIPRLFRLFFGVEFILTCLCAMFVLGNVSFAAQETQVTESEPEQSQPEGEVQVVAILRVDERGRNLRFPINVASDSEARETYVINGGKSNIVIYGKDYFPYLVLGAGRGVDSPQCVFFDQRKGLVYVGQSSTESKPSRLTILNGAFLPEKEVIFSGMPEAEEFSVVNGVVGAKGYIYLVGAQTRGVLVLDSEGNFSHWLKPLGEVHLAPVTTEDSSEKRRAYLTKMRGSDATAGEEAVAEEVAEEEDSARPVGMPESLRPKARNTMPRDASKGRGLHPVIVKDVAIDSDGRIFVLSEEMSKIYVYGPGENLIVSFGEKGGSPGKMSRPRGLGLDEKKQCIYVVDYMRHTVLVFDMAGRFIFEFGGRGDGPMWFDFPTAIAVDADGNVLVADLFNNRVQVLRSKFSLDYPVFGNTKGLPAKDQSAGEKR